MEVPHQPRKFIKADNTAAEKRRINPKISRPLFACRAQPPGGSNGVTVGLGGVEGVRVGVIGKIIQPKPNQLPADIKIRLGDKVDVLFK